MAAPSIAEGEIPFDAPGTSKPCKTWYKVIGDLTTPPLVALHGGPGAGHEYMTSLTDLHDKYKIPVIYYDQVGCGRSTRFPEKNGDSSFWTFNLFLMELENLVKHFNLHQLGFYILGQSWGGSKCYRSHSSYILFYIFYYPYRHGLCLHRTLLPFLQYTILYHV